MFSQESKLATAKTILATVGSIAATAMVVRSVVRDNLPSEFRDYLYRGLIRGLFNRFSTQLTMVVDEFDGLVNNEIYEAAEVYLGAKISPAVRRLKISKPEKEKNFNITMEPTEEVADIFNGVKFKWVWVCRHDGSRHFYDPRSFNSTLRSEFRSFELTFNKKYKDMVIDSYLPYIVNQAMLIKHEKKTLKIFTVDRNMMRDYRSRGPWTPVNFDHPATFETLAMDTELKDMILKDLQRFVKRKSYYRKVGKAWKRGYLLYGPPGTGKSSLIAAMANYLNFDIYDLELTDLRKNSDLRRLLVATANKSILVVEDIDCTIDLQNKLANRTSVLARQIQEGKTKVTLSGLLNFIDGLWSSCGDERIIIFTTNHIEKLDPALLRPGRMDVHVHMSYCTPCGFKLLAANYLGVNQHELFQEIEDLIRSIKVTPAEVAEQLLKFDEVDDTLNALIDFLHDKSNEIEEFKAMKAQEINQERTKQEGENKQNEVVEDEISVLES